VAINYSNLMGDIVYLTDVIIAIEADMAAQQTLRDTTVGVVQDNGMPKLLGPINRDFDLLIQQMESCTNKFVSLIRQRLLDRDTVLEELTKLSSQGIDQVLAALTEDMQDNSETVQRNVVTVTEVTPVVTNTTVGALVTSKLLPSNVRPGNGLRLNPHLAGVDSELALDDTVNIICTADSQDGLTEGTESWTVSGLQPQTRNPFESNSGGNKGRATMTTGGNNLITNFFEDFTSDIPDGWVETSGATAGSSYSENAVEVLNALSTYSLETDGVEVVLTFDLTDQLTPGALMTAWVWCKTNGAGTGSVELKLKVDGSATDTVSVDPSTYTSWTLIELSFVVPDNLGTAVLFELDSNFDDTLWFDGGGLSEMTMYAGVGFLMVAGEEPFLKNDTFPVTLANDDGGKIQRLFTRAFGWQLPSSASPTISDTTGAT